MVKGLKSELEINKVIVCFLNINHPIPSNPEDLSEKQLDYFLPFTRSLDSLVPVFKKLKTFNDIKVVFEINENNCSCTVYDNKTNKEKYQAVSKTIQMAASLAAAEAIFDIKEKRWNNSDVPEAIRSNLKTWLVHSAT